MEGTEQTSGRTDIAIGSACTCNRGGSGCCASPEMIQDLVIRHCSPTLAGLKCGSLFRVCSVPHGIADKVSEIQRRIADKGVRIRVLEGRCGDSLLYVYRPDLLAMRMLNPDTRDFMVSEGYDVSDPETLVDQLERRLGEGIAHEIGIFLGYPLEDVLGYIEAMKTFNAIRADKAGVITAILVNSGDSVEEDDPIFKIA